MENNEDKLVCWMGKDINDMSKEELIEALTISASLYRDLLAEKERRLV